LQKPPNWSPSDEEIEILRAWIDRGADFRIQVQDDAPAKPVDPKLAALITAARSGDTKAVGKLIAASARGPNEIRRPLLLRIARWENAGERRL